MFSFLHEPQNLRSMVFPMEELEKCLILTVADTNGMNLLHPSNQASLSAALSQSTSSTVKVRFPETGHSLSSQEALGSSANTPGKQWNLSIRSLRPRIFCLEHAIQTVDLLCSRGGANVLGLCHSGNCPLAISGLLLEE